MADPIRDHISSLRAEIRRKYDEGMRALDALEATLVGMTTEQHPVAVVKASRAAKRPTTRNHKGSNVNAVLDAIRSDFLTIDEIAEATGLPVRNVRFALYQKRAQSVTESKKLGKRSAYRVKPSAVPERHIPAQSGGMGVTDCVRKVLRESETPLRLKDVADRVEPIATTNAKNIRTAVGATLSNLTKSGEFVHNDDGTYQIAN